MSQHGPMMTLRERSKVEAEAHSTRTPQQTELTECAWQGCRELFSPRFPGQRFHLAKCRAAYARHIGMVGTLVSSRRLRRRISLIIHTEDAGVLDAPLGTRFRLVREPQ